MRRRVVVIAGLAALLLAPEWAGAQQPPVKIPRIGILTAADSDRTPIFDAFREGLRDLGYVERRNIFLEFRLAHGDFSLLPKLAAELVNLPADIIVADNGLCITGITGNRGQSRLSCCLAPRSRRGRPLGSGVTRRRSVSASWRSKLASPSAHPPLVAARSASTKPGSSAVWSKP